MSERKNKIFYGWYVVIACCAVMAVFMGTIMNCFGQFIKPVCADFGCTRQQMSFTLTLMSGILMLMGLFWGTIIKKVRFNKWMYASSVLTPALFFCYSFATNVKMLWLITIPLSIFYCFLSLLGVTYIVGNWFVEKKGFALGIATMGANIGAMIMNSVISQLIIHVGWQHTYSIVAVIIFVIAAPCAFFVVREKPSDKGLVPLGYKEKERGSSSNPVNEGVPFSEAIKTKLFWVIVITSLTVVFSVGALYMFITPHLTDNGYAITFAATVTSIGMGEMALGKVVLGKIFDKLGARKTNYISSFSLALGLIGLIFCKSFIGIGAMLVGILLGTSFGVVCTPVILQSVFGMKDYGAIFGKISAASSLGASLTPVISGWVYDISGSYAPLYIACIVIALVSMVCLDVVLPKEQKA